MKRKEAGLQLFDKIQLHLIFFMIVQETDMPGDKIYCTVEHRSQGYGPVEKEEDRYDTSKRLKTIS